MTGALMGFLSSVFRGVSGRVLSLGLRAQDFGTSLLLGFFWVEGLGLVRVTRLSRVIWIMGLWGCRQVLLMS